MPVAHGKETMMHRFRMRINGTYQDGTDKRVIFNPFDGTAAGEVTFAGPGEINEAVAAACDSFKRYRSTPLHERAAVLRAISKAIEDNGEELAQLLRMEAGKPIKLARGEVFRAATTFACAAEEAVAMHGELLPMDRVPGGDGRTGMVRRVPIGPILGITPFNFPLNLVAHKVAPAIAAGNTMVLKPASQTPMSALRLGELCLLAGLPAGVVNIVPSDARTLAGFIPDERLKALTFTGSAAVGWRLKSLAGKKRVTLELGGNAAVIVEPDVRENLDQVARRLALGAFMYAGQVCISVQRIFVHASIAARFLEALAAQAADPGCYGDPSDESVICGPLISEADVMRILGLIDQAVAAGGRLICGGRRLGQVIAPTVLASVPADHPIVAEEAFGPVVVVQTYDRFDDALDMVNDSRYGLQAGIFTNDVNKILRAFDRLDVGGIIHNDYSTYRTDPMPYGGIKDSGFGREGVRYAMEEGTELKLLVLKSE
ncbi:aldehyde dehydrogenase family protein [bacterium]|nr:aldehyde dehydrogenase family protein [candidate division CSSED10-310 bacterium]